MINLLPEGAISEVRKIYKKRFLAFGLILAILLALISFVFMIPSYIISGSRLAQAEELLAAARARPVSKQAEALAATARTLNERIKIATIEDGRESPVSTLDAILKHKKQGTTFSLISFSDESINLRGRASSRSAFLSLMADLKSDPLFVEVNSPISSLIATSSLDFSIQMTLAKPKK
jgi:Tfp pilus assembly protein PilN